MILLDIAELWKARGHMQYLWFSFFFLIESIFFRLEGDITSTENRKYKRISLFLENTH